MTVAFIVSRKLHWMTLCLTLVLALAAPTIVWAQQTQPPPRRTQSKTKPKPAPNSGQPGNPQPAQPEQPQTQPGESAVQPPVIPPPVQEQAQPNEPVGRDETGRVRIDPEVQRKIDEMLKQDEAGRKAGELGQPATPGAQTPNPAGAQTPNPAGAQNPNPAGAQNQPVPPPGSPTPDALKTPAQRAADRRKARAAAEGQTATPPGGQPATPGQPAVNIPQPQPLDAGMHLEPPGETTVLQIEPEPEGDPVPPEQRKYGFSIKNGTYEQLIKGFAHQTGLGVLGETPKEGTVNFETTETLSFTDALSRMRMLLFNYKAHEPYWMLYEGTHLRVIRVTDFYRILPIERMYRSIEEFEEAKLPDDEIALVIYTPKTGSIAELRQVRDFLPDYVRITPLENGNSVSIFALVSDIKKYMELIKKLGSMEGIDPRVTERFDVHNISATEAVNRLRQLSDLDNASRNPGAAASRGPRGAQPREPSPLDQMSDPLVVLIPDDSQGYILVRGMPNKIEEIRKLLPFVDISMAAEGFAPVVVKVQHADAGDLVTAIQQVLTASSAPSPAGAAPPPASSPRRNKKPAGGGASAAVPVSADSITLLPHPTQNAILVIADEAGVNRVRDLVALFDVKAMVGPLRLQLEVADASEVVSTITLVLGGGGVGVKGAAPAAESYQLVPDPSGSSIWYSGSESDLEQVRSLISALDVAGSAPSLHIVQLVYQQPSFVADILRQFDGVAPQAAEPAPAGAKPKTRRAKSTHSASKFTPLDEQKKLYILCNTDDFTRYQEIIAKLDQPENEKDLFIRVPVKHLDSTTAVDKLASLLPNTPVNQDMRMISVDQTILLVGASPTDVQIIEKILAEIDKPSNIETRTFVIKHADPGDIKTAIETLVPAASSEGRGSGGGSRRRSRSVPSAVPAGEGGAKAAAPPASTDATVSDEMTIFQIGNQLVVKASPPVLDQVAQVVAQFDVEGADSDMRVYADFPPNSDIVGISETLMSVFGGPGSRGPRGPKGAAAVSAEGARFIPQPASNRLVVMAEPSEFAEIEKLLKVLREDIKAEASILEIVPVEHADPTVLVEEIRPLLDMKIRGLVEAGEIVEPAAEGTTPTTVPRPGRAKKLQQVGANGEKYHIAADSHNERIVIAAPQRIVDEAKKLIKQFDVPATKKNIIMKNVELVNATPAEMVKAVKEMMGKPSGGGVTRRPTPGKAGAAPGAAPAASSMESLGGEGLVVMEAPGGADVLLRGTKEDVEQAEDWIHQLDAMSTPGRSIKLYNIVTTDLDMLFDLIVSVVESSSAARPAAGGPPKRATALPGAKSTETEDEDEFATSRTHASADTYLRADLINDTLLAATTPSKLKQIDDLVKQFETDEKLGQSMEEAQVPSFKYNLEHADATDAKWDLEDLLEVLWKGKELPKIEKFKEMLIVSYPDESRFDEIREFIRDIDKPSDKPTKIVRKSFVPPAGLSPEATVIWIRQNHPDWDLELDDLGAGKVQPTFGVEQLRPLDESNHGNKNGAGNGNTNGTTKPPARGRVDAVRPCYFPLFQRVTDAVVASALAQTPPEEEEPSEDPVEEPPHEEEEPVIHEPVPQPVPRDFGDRLIRQATTPILPPASKDKKSNTDEAGKDDKDKDDKKKKSKDSKKAKLIWNNNDGVYWIEGEPEAIDEIEESLDDLEEEQDDIFVPPDIRIYRVRYIDVYTAQGIIEEMFNATKAMQANFAQQQAQQQQLARQQQQQQMQQQRLQQQQNQQGRGQEGKDGKEGPQNPQQQQQQMAQMQMPQLPAPAVRVYPNPRDRSLILRAETSQFPHILELLATIDQPKPIDSKTRTYPLKRVNAAEMEQMLREALHLDEAGARPRANAARNPAIPGAMPAPAASPGGALPETILQESFTGSLLGVDPQDITLFSSETANTIMAVAPPAALDYIGKMIEQFESGDLPERLTRFYQLQHASATDVAQQLEDYFAAKNPRSSGGSRASASRRGGGDSPAPSATSHEGGGLNAPSFIPYDRLNQLTVHGTQEQITEVESVLTRLDVASEEDAWKDVALAHADAKLVADTLTEMFGGNGGGGAAPAPGGRAGRGASADRGGNGAKFIGESGGHIVFFSAPKARHQEILATVAKLEEKSKQTSEPRIIELKNATPSQVAEAIEKAYDTRRTGQQGSAPKAPRFTVTAHDPSRRIFVVADDEMFAQIGSLVTTLDTPGSAFGPEFRIYPLQYANARAVHGQMTKLMTEYLQRLGGDAKKIEAFSVQPDETANALVVLGTPSIFGFIEENIRKIDNPKAAQTQTETHVVELKNADPDGVTRALNEIFVRNAQKSPDGDVPITISAVAGSKAIMIRANAVDFARIQTAMNELDTEQVANAGEVRVVSLLYGDAAEIKTALESAYKKPAGSGARSEQLIGDVRLAVLPQTNAIMISGEKETLDRLESIARGMDIAGEKGSVPQIIPLKFASASLVLPALKEMFSDSKLGGGRKNYTPPIIVADEAANALIVRAAPQELASIQGIVSQLDTEDKVDKSGPRIVQLAAGVNVEDLAELVTESVNESAKARMGAAGAKGAQIPSIIAIPNLRTNTITLAGSAMLFDEAEALIKSQEKMGPAGGKVTAVISPQNIPMQDLQRLIDQLTQQNSGNSRRGSPSGGSRPPRGNR